MPDLDLDAVQAWLATAGQTLELVRQQASLASNVATLTRQRDDLQKTVQELQAQIDSFLSTRSAAERLALAAAQVAMDAEADRDARLSVATERVKAAEDSAEQHVKDEERRVTEEVETYRAGLAPETADLEAKRDEARRQYDDAVAALKTLQASMGAAVPS